jgi:hypothetical protein
MLLSIVLQNDAACAVFKTKELAPIMADMDMAIVVTKERIVAWFMLKDVTAIISIYELGYLLLLLDSILTNSII